MFNAEFGVHPAESGASCDQPNGKLAKGEIGFVGLGQMGTAMVGIISSLPDIGLLAMSGGRIRWAGLLRS
jgi:hypothetical protein